MVNFRSASTGTPLGSHMTELAGIDVRHIPYKSSPQIPTDVIDGTSDVSLTPLITDAPVHLWIDRRLIAPLKGVASILGAVAAILNCPFARELLDLLRIESPGDQGGEVIRSNGDRWIAHRPRRC